MPKQNLEKLYDIEKWVSNSPDFKSEDSAIVMNCVQALVKIFKSVQVKTKKTDYRGVPPTHAELVAIIDWIRANDEISDVDQLKAAKTLDKLILIVKKVIGNQRIRGTGSIIRRI